MKRRELFGALGAGAAVVMSTRVMAQDHSQKLGQGIAFPKLLASTANCVAKGQVCLAHCIELLGDGMKVMSACAKSVNQMLTLCSALENLLAQNSNLVPDLVKLTLKACERCAEECKEHVDHHAQCKACYEACVECIKECKALLKA